MQIYCSTHLVILNVKATQYTCLLNSIYHPPLTSTVKSSLFMHAHSSPLSLTASLHQCCANHSHINNGWTFSGQTSYIQDFNQPINALVPIRRQQPHRHMCTGHLCIMKEVPMRADSLWMEHRLDLSPLLPPLKVHTLDLPLYLFSKHFEPLLKQIKA